MRRAVCLFICVAVTTIVSCGKSDSGAIDLDSGSTNVADIPKHIEDFKDNSNNGLVQARAMYALAKVGSPAVPPLIKALESDNVSVRLMALNTLNLIGTDAKSAIPAIKKTLNDKDAAVQKRAKDVLAKVSAPSP